MVWTLNLELTPVYAAEPAGHYAAGVYELFGTLLAGEVAAQDGVNLVGHLDLQRGHVEPMPPLDPGDRPAGQRPLAAGAAARLVRHLTVWVCHVCWAVPGWLLDPQGRCRTPPRVWSERADPVWGAPPGRCVVARPAGAQVVTAAEAVRPAGHVEQGPVVGVEGGGVVDPPAVAGQGENAGHER